MHVRVRACVRVYVRELLSVLHVYWTDPRKEQVYEVCVNTCKASFNLSPEYWSGFFVFSSQN